MSNDDVTPTVADRWIISRLQEVEQHVRESIEQYRFDHAAQTLYEFTWNEFCDWYLELVKPVLNDPACEPAVQRGTRRTLVRVLETLQRLLHPIMPFITEAVWQRIAPLAGKNGETIMREPYPTPDASKIDAAASADLDWIKGFVLGLRQVRGEMDIKPSQKLTILLKGGDEHDRARVTAHRQYLDSLGRIQSIEWLEADAEPPEAATALLGGLEILIPLAGLIDVGAERERLSRDVDKRRKDLSQIEKKLANPSFVERAPAEVVAKDRARVTDLTAAIEKLEQQLERLAKL